MSAQTATATCRPILFSAPMVRAILDGSKTQTRRVAKPPAKANFLPDDYWRIDVDEPGTAYLDDESGRMCIVCPYGAPRGELWVRETWAYTDGYRDHTGRDPDCVWYRADGQARFVGTDGCSLTGETWDAGVSEAECQVKTFCGKWRPSIFMPRWASRITLRITDVRVQRLNEISEADAKAEGATQRGALWSMDWSRVGTLSRFAGGIYPRGHEQALSVADVGLTTARMAFANLWESINGPDSWAANPWVWCLTFERIMTDGK